MIIVLFVMLLRSFIYLFIYLFILQAIKTPILNFIGISLCIAGLAIYLQVKSVPNASKGKKYISVDGKESDTSLLGVTDPFEADTESRGSTNLSSFSMNENTPRINYKIENSSSNKVDDDSKAFGASWSVSKKRFVGFSMAALAGFLFGISFNPSQYVIDNEYHGKDDTLNYVFPHFCGIILTSWVYFIGYCIYMTFNSKPLFVNPDCILPAAASGLLWGVAEISWFMANKNLGFSVSFPIITSGPGFIGSMWGIFYFKEIAGFNNLATLGAAFCVTLPGLILIALSH
jgi:hypothetical protein